MAPAWPATLALGTYKGNITVRPTAALPASFTVPTGRLPLANGRVTFIRRVSWAGTVTLLSQTFRVGKKHKGLYLRLVIDTKRGKLTAYLNGRVLKRWPYELLND